jgi:hypothetical protein
VFGDDPLRLFRLDISRAIADPVDAAEQDDVSAREHVQNTLAAAKRRVIDVRVRRQENELALDGGQRLVAEQLCSAEASA